MNVVVTHIAIEAARAKLGVVATQDLQRMAKRLKAMTGKGSSFASRDNLVDQIAVAQELASRMEYDMATKYSAADTRACELGWRCDTRDMFKWKHHTCSAVYAKADAIPAVREWLKLNA